MRLDGERAIAAGEAGKPKLDSQTDLPQDTQIDFFTGPRIAEKHKKTLREQEDAEPLPSLDDLLAREEAKKIEPKRKGPPPLPKTPPPLPAEAVGIDVNKDIRMELTSKQIIGRDIKEVLKKIPGSSVDFGAAVPLSSSEELQRQGDILADKFHRDNNLIDHDETLSELGFRFDVTIDNDGSVPLGFLGRNRRRFNELMTKEKDFAARYGMAKNKTNPMDVRRKESWVSRLGKKLGFLGGVAGATAGIGGQIQERFHEDVAQRGTEMAQKLDAEDLAKLRTGQELPIEVKPIDPSFVGFTEKEGSQVEGKNAFTFTVGASLPSDFARVTKKMHDGKTSIQLDGGIIVSKRTDDKGTDSYFFKDKDNGEVFRAVAVKDGHITGEARWDNDNLTKKAGTTTGLTTGKIAVTRGLDKNFALTSAPTRETITTAFSGATYEPGSGIDFGSKSRVQGNSGGKATKMPVPELTIKTDFVDTGTITEAKVTAKTPVNTGSEPTTKFAGSHMPGEKIQAAIDRSLITDSAAEFRMGGERPAETAAQKADREAHAEKYRTYLAKEKEILSGKTIQIPESDPKSDPDGQLDQLRWMEAQDQLKKAQEELNK